VEALKFDIGGEAWEQLGRLISASDFEIYIATWTLVSPHGTTLRARSTPLGRFKQVSSRLVQSSSCHLPSKRSLGAAQSVNLTEILEP
jgi:hypothetical protein